MTTTVDTFLLEGCGRCSLGATPACKVHRWVQELHLLRSIALDSGLTETCKWGVPCYTFQGQNVILISALKECCSVSFLKGSLLDDKEGLLELAGPNSKVARVLRFTELAAIHAHRAAIGEYLRQAIELVRTGAQVEPPPSTEPLPQELIDKLDADPALRTAFESLTPGRQRGYVLYFAAPKQSATRVARIEKSIGNILNGVGLHDHYQRNR